MHRSTSFLLVILLACGLAGCQPAHKAAGTTTLLHPTYSQPAQAVRTQAVAVFTPTRPDSGQSHWQSHPNVTEAAHLVIDRSGNIWSAGRGGVLEWDTQTKIPQSFTTSEGLTDNFVTALAVAPDGALWAGTNSGRLARYADGAWSRLQPDPGSIITGLAVAPDGLVWIGTERGVSKFDGKRWFSWSVKQGLPDAYVQSIAVTSSGAVWAGFIGAVAAFDGQAWHTHALEKGQVVSSILAAPDQTLWFAAQDALVHFDGQRWQAYQAAGTPLDFASLAISPHGDVWLSVPGAGLLRFDAQNLRFVKYAFADIAGLVFDATGSLWVGSHSAGIFQFDGSVFSGYTPQGGPLSNFVVSSAVAADGSLWFGTDRGVSRFDGQSWKNYTTADGPGNASVLSIAAAPDGPVWFGTENGVSVFDGATWKNYSADDGLFWKNINEIVLSPEGNVWALSTRGLFQFILDHWNVVVLPNFSPDDSFETIAAASDTGIWTAATSGIMHFDGVNWVTINLPVRAPIQRIVQSDARDLWIETRGAGLFFIDGQMWDQLSPGHVTTISLGDGGLVHALIDSADTPLDGVLWRVYTPGGNLPGSQLRLIARRPEGGIWLVTERGIFHPAGEAWTDVSGPLKLGADPLGSLLDDQAGSLWIASSLGGITRFTP